MRMVSAAGASAMISGFRSSISWPPDCRKPGGAWIHSTRRACKKALPGHDVCAGGMAAMVAALAARPWSQAEAWWSATPSRRKRVVGKEQAISSPRGPRLYSARKIATGCVLVRFRYKSCFCKLHRTARLRKRLKIRGFDSLHPLQSLRAFPCYTPVLVPV
jgi:hypothetical protein